MAPDAATMRMDSTRERALVARARVDASAFGELYDFYLPRIYAFIARRVGERAVAEDLTATTFERGLAVVRGGDFRNDSFGGWLYRVASNAIVDHVRRDRHTVPLGVRASDGARGTTDDAETIGDDRALAAFSASLERDVLARALHALPEQHRRVIVLRFFDDLDTAEMCATLGCSPGTLAVKLHRALRALRGAMATESIDAA
ncbi:MAG TPA: sigma-70 family RNA polymerase sigma factor [Candidatus Limnocylindrales bacterium]